MGYEEEENERCEWEIEEESEQGGSHTLSKMGGWAKGIALLLVGLFLIGLFSSLIKALDGFFSRS